MRDLLKFVEGVQAYIAAAVKPVADRLKALEETVGGIPAPLTLDDVKPLVDEAVKAIPAPKDGENGKDADPESFLPKLKEWFDAEWKGLSPRELLLAEVAAIPRPENGKDGLDGKDGDHGKSVTLDDVMGVIDVALAKMEAQNERRITDFLQRAVAMIPQPTNGKDGLDLRNFSAKQEKGGRVVLLTLSDGDRTEEVRLEFPVILDRGYYAPGKAYEEGDAVTYGGSLWIAQSATDTAPVVDDPTWRKAVMKGRDARSVRVDESRKIGPVKVGG